MIAAFVTAYARLKLYEYIEGLGDRVLYFDTGSLLFMSVYFSCLIVIILVDSVIYIWRPGMYTPQLGDFLGQMTDELDGGEITKFVSGGPKVSFIFMFFSFAVFKI